MKAIKYYILSFSLSASLATAQTVMTSSPYSMFGVGEIAQGLYGQNMAMGNVAYGMRGASLINGDNPAGLAGIDSCRLLAEASLFARWESYRSGGNSNQAATGNMSAFSLAGRLMRNWYMAVGVTPYSFVGYYFLSSQPLEGTGGTYYDSEFAGSGGLSKAYITQAVRLGRHWSAGVNLNYIFGNITQSETQTNMATNQTLYGQAFMADFGLQYTHQVGKEAMLTLGAVYGYSQRIRLENSMTLTNGETTTDIKQKAQYQHLPQFAGIGGALGYKKMTYALDYTFRQYGSLSSDDNRVKFKDTHELRLGVCYAPAGYPSESAWKRFSYKAGVDLSTPYMQIKGQTGTAYRVSAGLGMPVLGGEVNAAVFYDRMKFAGTTLDRSILGLTITYTLSERMYKVRL